MIFRLSERLNSKLKAGPLAAAPLDENPYADWSARLFTADRAQYILVSHTRSLYSVVMFGRGITDDNRFTQRALDNLREVMTSDGLGLIYVNFVARSSASVRFCKALDRSVTGSMNELETTAKAFLDGGERSPFEVSFRLNETWLSAIGSPKSGNYATPREAFKQLRV